MKIIKVLLLWRIIHHITQRQSTFHMRYHFVREQIEMQTLAVQYIDTHLMLADALTKSLGKSVFELLRCKYMSS